MSECDCLYFTVTPQLKRLENIGLPFVTDPKHVRLQNLE